MVSIAAMQGDIESARLKLLGEVNNILSDIDELSVRNEAPSPPKRWLGELAQQLDYCSRAYLVLRTAGHSHASNILVRSALEAFINALAVAKEPGYYYNNCYKQINDELPLYTDDDQCNDAREAMVLARQRCATEHSGYSTKWLKNPTVRDMVDLAQVDPDLSNSLRFQYRIYCQYTHGTIRAVRRELAQTTESSDTCFLVWLVLQMVELLQRELPQFIAPVDLRPFQVALVTQCESNVS